MFYEQYHFSFVSSGYQSWNTAAGYHTLSDTEPGRMSYRLKRGSTTSTEGFVAPACDSFGIVHHSIKQFIRRAVYERHVLARETLIEIYRNAFSHALPDTLFKAELLAHQSLSIENNNINSIQWQLESVVSNGKYKQNLHCKFQMCKRISLYLNCKIIEKKYKYERCFSEISPDFTRCTAISMFPFAPC